MKCKLANLTQHRKS